ncbi:MAG TPA: thioredoxin domain-containing protein [Bacteroidales bacterium]|nr:thioredoxin domain-containing protein [Bacteroidales bacterium]
MKRFIFVFTIVITLALSEGNAQENGIRFNNKPWSEILTMAKKENKLIFLDAYASWCGPCKWMAANMFTNDTVADFYNKTFICASFDMEKGEGIQLRRQYEVRAYPTLLFIDGDGNMIHRKVGAERKAIAYVNIGNTALDPQKCLSSYIRKYESGNYPEDYLPVYLQALTDAYLPVESVLQKYFASASGDQIYDQESWNIINRFVTDMNSPLFAFVVKNRAEYVKRYSQDTVFMKISTVYVNGLLRSSRDIHFTDSSYRALQEKIRQTGYEEADKVFFYSDLSLYQFRGEKDKFLELAYEKMDKFYHDDYNMLNNIAWSVQQMTNDKKYLDKALSWAKRSIALQNEPFNNDTYAIIQLKLGNKEEAIKYEKIALQLARKKNESASVYEDTLKKMMQP